MRKWIVLACLLLAACSPSGKDIKEADIGPYPDNYKQIIWQWLRHNLKDPYAVQDLVIAKPTRESYGSKGVLSSGHYYGWRTCAFYNSRDSVGTFVGTTPEIFWIAHGKVVHRTPPEDTSGCFGR
ncbi:MAG: hypothetical protein O2912_02065 [Proteobacteria bacterium]|nr:hypothetical protein [Pseudomonadota bacterium]